MSIRDGKSLGVLSWRFDAVTTAFFRDVPLRVSNKSTTMLHGYSPA